MDFPEFDISLLRQKELVVRFTDETKDDLFRLLHDNGCRWSSGDSLLTWSTVFQTDEDNCHAISISEHLRVLHGSTGYFIEEEYAIFDYVNDVRVVCPVDDLL